MPTPVYVSPFTGTVVTQTQVTYEDLALSSNQQLYWPSSTPINSYSLPRILDVTPSTTGLSITLPQANQGTLGADSLIRNMGANSFTVYGYNQSQSWVIAAGESWYFYLNDNTTEEGFWQNIKFGTGTSSADAATLTGNGLQTVNGTLWTSQGIVGIINPPTLSLSSSGYVYDWQSGNGTITLPTAASINYGWYIGFRNSGTGSLIFQTQGTSLINNFSSVVTNPGDSGYIVFDDATGNFITIGLIAQNQSLFTSSVYDVDNVVGSTLDLTLYAPVIQTYVALSGTRSTTLNIDLPPITQIYIVTNNTGQTSYDLSFNVAGSLGTPVILPTGSVATLLTDGVNISAVTQSILTGNYLANDGAATSPTYSFTSDTNTGLYLDNLNILGIAANSTQMMLIDNSVPASPVVTVTGELKAGSIQGGTF